MAGALATRAEEPPDPGDPAATLARLFHGTAATPDWFAPAFLATVPLARVQTIANALVRKLIREE